MTIILGVQDTEYRLNIRVNNQRKTHQPPLLSRFENNYLKAIQTHNICFHESKLCLTKLVIFKKHPKTSSTSAKTLSMTWTLNKLLWKLRKRQTTLSVFLPHLVSMTAITSLFAETEYRLLTTQMLTLQVQLKSGLQSFHDMILCV